MDFEKLGLFYLGREVDVETKEKTDNLLLYDAKDLTTHAMCVGMTGSGKTGLCIGLLEEAAMDRIPAIVVDPKGDMTNLLLGFPDMTAADFEPWVRAEEAQAKGISVQEYAAQQAETWRSGLAGWGIVPERIRTMWETTEFALYTPGSSAGKPLSILKLLNVPASQVAADSELMVEQVSGTASSLLSLIGIEADPLQSREHILIANILHQSREQQLDLPQLIAAIQNPPFSRVGIMELEDFFPQKERFALALRFNNLLASPQFAGWLEGESLDIDNLLYTETGKPKISILSISHLNDNERMFFVSLLLNQLVNWMRTQSGTSSLRALFYMDEIFGYFPPVANPPSKQPLLTLLKQARAYGLGIVLTTQNPVDLDYKALANIGTWFIGRLQTERDKVRLLDGLEGAAVSSGSAFDRRSMDTLLSGLGKRRFLMNNVHETEPILFETRWTMSYLAGPLLRNQIRELTAGRYTAGGISTAAGTGAAFGIDAASGIGAAFGLEPADRAIPAAPTPTPIPPAASAPIPAPLVAAPIPTSIPASTPAPTPPAATPAPTTAAPAQPDHTPAVTDKTAADGLLLTAPAAPQGVPVYYFRAQEEVVLQPALIGLAEVNFEDQKKEISTSREESWLTFLQEGLVTVAWQLGDDLKIQEQDLKTRAPERASYVPLPEIAQEKTSFTQWERDLKDVIYRRSRLELFHNPGTGLVSRPEEDLREFKIRLEQVLREQRDEAVQKLRDKYQARILRAEEKVRRQEQQLSREVEQAEDAKRQTAISVGATILGAFMGRKTFSASTLGRATTAARSRSRSQRQGSDVDRAEETLIVYQDELKALEAELEQEVELLHQTFDHRQDEIETVEIAPRKTDIRLRAFALVWLPEGML